MPMTSGGMFLGDPPKEEIKIETPKELLDHFAKWDEQDKKWDIRFLELAMTVAKWSKDPSRKVGAVIVAPNRSIVSLGYNGFARGVKDTEERLNTREIKYELVVHAEVNAILSGGNLEGCKLYSTLMPCSRCAAIIINSGIIEVVCLVDENSTADNSKVHFDLTEQQFQEANVEIKRYTLAEYNACINK